MLINIDFTILILTILLFLASFSVLVRFMVKNKPNKRKYKKTININNSVNVPTKRSLNGCPRRKR